MSLCTCSQMFAKSEEWKRGDKWQKEETGKIRSMDDGSIMRNHPHLMRPATADEKRDLRVAAILQADEVETVQTGYAQGKHKLLAIQLTFANLSVDLRFDHDVIQMLGIVRHPAVVACGQAAIFAGEVVLCHTLCNTLCNTPHNTLCNKLCRCRQGWQAQCPRTCD